MELTFVTALTLGFLGSSHCVGMCGGIVGALSAGRNNPGALFRFHLAYNAGRILTYVIAGAGAGLIGAQARNVPLDVLIPVGSIIGALFMIALGLYLGGWWRAIARLERAGGHIWKTIQPLGNRFLPIRNLAHAFGLGLVWGWLPCGLVYSALALALLSATPSQGATTMLGFGLGTLPLLLVMGQAAGQLGKIARHPGFRRAAGGLVILFGLYTGVTGFTGHHEHTAPAPHHGGTHSTQTM